MIPGRKTPFFKTLFQNILNGTLEKSLPAIQGLEAFIRHVSRTRVPCGGCQARSKAQGSGPCPAGVRGFKSHPPHHAVRRVRSALELCAILGKACVPSLLDYSI